VASRLGHRTLIIETEAIEAFEKTMDFRCMIEGCRLYRQRVALKEAERE
jgi:hypothetical protein